ncbi:hypothetical protein ACC755_09820 [Rhizobium ruizarguesonis]|uniref:hypothetical protein n=1 Tax=Rhizobium ruizarguesonis TaxID=2081791 RepID=UPI0018D4EE5D|nr:hypothetical protein [Rhizobium ruizarguesonis]
MSAGPAYPSPNARRLRIFSFDPALAAQYDLAGVSGVTIEVSWETDLKSGPVGEYIEVVDVDPGSNAAYAPIDLNAPELLATDGLVPSESDPRFHQQMVYAVAMKTIEHFERALGRKALWSPHRSSTSDKFAENYVPRLRIYPHALRQQNAYYSPLKKALLFGYFAGSAKSAKIVAGTAVFTCLSHDIIAHETTHALLDGVHPRFNEPVNEDVLAFHEAFADIVALFQHFSYPGVLRDQIARTRGDLGRESELGKLAQQFARASGRGNALRSYLGSDEDGKWKAATPDPTLLRATSEPHDRGAILVAAVFGAFMKVYENRTGDLFRIASEGTGVLREGDIHPDLVNRLAEEAQRCAERALQMCIRAIDYCPPVAITFGTYLRAIVTADHDMNPADRENWRLAFIESFREWGISPRGVRSMAEDSLLWPTEKEVVEEQTKAEARINATAPTKEEVERTSQRSREAMTKLFGYQQSVGMDDEYAQKAARSTSAVQQPIRPDNVLTPIALSMSRYDIWLNADKQAALFHSWLMDEDGAWLADALGLVVNLNDSPKTISARKNDPNRANIEIHSVRTAMKRGVLGFPEQHMVVVVTQWRAGFFDRGQQTDMDNTTGAWALPGRDFKYRAGCTLLIDPEQMKIRRVIRTPGNVADDGELDRMRRYLLQGLSPPNAFAGVAERFKASAEPFAFLHSHAGE